jgi:hypothetical protein
MEIASLNARRRAPDGTCLTATYALNDEGTVTRQITEVDGRAVDNKPAVFRFLDEDERRVNCADRLSAIGFLAGVITAEDWTVT